jgi:hypothetical protein
LAKIPTFTYVYEHGVHRYQFPEAPLPDVSITIEAPEYDKFSRLMATVTAHIGGFEANPARLNLLDQQQRVDFASVAATLDGQIPWHPYLLVAVPDLRKRLAEQQTSGTFGADTISQPPADPWPKLHHQAYHGLAGIITMAIDPYSEADQVAVLLNILTAFGNVVGLGPHFQVEHTKHSLRLFAVLVGETSKARKGLFWSTPRYIFSCIDEAWAQDRVTAGLSSGEGLIYAVRDERWEKQPIREKSRVVDYQLVMVDAGVADKRLLLIEEEFAQALKVMAREGNILSPIMRQAWDSGHLHPLTKSNPIRATGAHISIVAHITMMELLRLFTDIEMANGYGNRFLWALVRRSKMIPNPTGMPTSELNPLIIKLQKAINIAKNLGEMRRDSETEQRWVDIYPELSQGKPGLLGALTARAEAQVMRLAAIYAAIDGTAVIQLPHLEAALAVWRYSKASARYIFGSNTGDAIADRILSALDEQGHLDLTAISLLFDKNVQRARIQRALPFLVELNVVETLTIKNPKGGRPATIVRRT